VTYLDVKKRAIWRMVDTVKRTVRGANGRHVLRMATNKDLCFTEEELKAYGES